MFYLFYILYFVFAFAFFAPLTYASNNHSIESLNIQVETLEKELKELKQELQEQRTRLKKDTNLEQKTLSAPPFIGIPIVTSPYLGVPPAFNGSDLMSAMPILNQDVSLMEQRQTLINQGLNSPIILMSGEIQPIFTEQKSYSGTSLGALSVYEAELDTAAIFNPWVEGFLTIETGTSSYSTPSINAPFDNIDLSISVDNAFVTIGNLKSTPFYTSAGQIYIPFGQSLTNMITYPMTYNLSQTRMIASTIGYSSGGNNGWSATVSAYPTNTTLGQRAAGDSSITYQFGNNQMSGIISGSLISNMADAGMFQVTSAPEGEFAGFSENASTEAIHQTPAYDFNGTLTLGSYSFLAEFLSALKAFDTSALSYNGNGAQPIGINVEGAYAFQWLTKPSTFALGYGWTNQSLGLQQPQQRFSAIINVSWWQDTVESLEFRHDVDYATSDYASGIGSTTLTQGSGGTADTLTLSLDAYF